MFPSLEKVALNYGENIYPRGEMIRNDYFLNSGIIWLLASIEESSWLEVGIVGRERMVGPGVFLGVKTTLRMAVVQGSVRR